MLVGGDDGGASFHFARRCDSDGEDSTMPGSPTSNTYSCEEENETLKLQVEGLKKRIRMSIAPLGDLDGLLSPRAAAQARNSMQQSDDRLMVVLHEKEELENRVMKLEKQKIKLWAGQKELKEKVKASKRESIPLGADKELKKQMASQPENVQIMVQAIASRKEDEQLESQAQFDQCKRWLKMQLDIKETRLSKARDEVQKMHDQMKLVEDDKLQQVIINDELQVAFAEVRNMYDQEREYTTMLKERLDQATGELQRRGSGYGSLTPKKTAKQPGKGDLLAELMNAEDGENTDDIEDVHPDPEVLLQAECDAMKLQVANSIDAEIVLRLDARKWQQESESLQERLLTAESRERVEAEAKCEGLGNQHRIAIQAAQHSTSLALQDRVVAERKLFVFRLKVDDMLFKFAGARALLLEVFFAWAVRYRIGVLQDELEAAPDPLEHTELKCKVHEVQEQHTQLQSDAATGVSELEAHAHEIGEAAKKEHAELVCKIEALQVELTAALGKVEGLKQECERLNALVHKGQSKSFEMESAVSNENAELKTQISEAVNHRNALQHSLDVAVASERNVKQELADLRTTMAAFAADGKNGVLSLPIVSRRSLTFLDSADESEEQQVEQQRIQAVASGSPKRPGVRGVLKGRAAITHPVSSRAAINHPASSSVGGSCPLRRREQQLERVPVHVKSDQAGIKIGLTPAAESIAAATAARKASGLAMAAATSESSKAPKSKMLINRTKSAPFASMTASSAGSMSAPVGSPAYLRKNGHDWNFEEEVRRHQSASSRSVVPKVITPFSSQGGAAMVSAGKKLQDAVDDNGDGRCEDDKDSTGNAVVAETSDQSFIRSPRDRPVRLAVSNLRNEALQLRTLKARLRVQKHQKRTGTSPITALRPSYELVDTYADSVTDEVGKSTSIPNGDDTGSKE